MSTKDHSSSNSNRVIDPLLQQRLANLGSQRAGGGVGASLPPPTLPGARSVPAPAPTPSTRRAPRRVKPARASKVAALTMSIAATAGLTGWFAKVDASGATAAALGSTSADNTPLGASPAGPLPTTAPTATPSGPAPTAAPTTAAPTTAAAPATIADGTYVGATVNTRYGPVQVEVLYQNGSLADAGVLAYPDSNRRDLAINSYALPRLRDEALATQSATIDTVSGATYTSNGYRKSLQSAIDAAKQSSGIAG